MENVGKECQIQYGDIFFKLKKTKDEKGTWRYETEKNINNTKNKETTLLQTLKVSADQKRRQEIITQDRKIYRK